ncbi:MAG: ribosome biogenesis GTP-binding protein YihA/YsxC [Stomatobaculum sp.]
MRREDGSLQIREAVLEFVCGVTSAVPETQLPEFAFAGKSNVGKSSLLNALVNRKALARTSAQPGKTQTINFYRVNGSFYLVDLPGYGYANAGEQAKAAWGKMIENYLHTAPRLKAVFLLVDIRHVPSENDCLMYEWIAGQELKPLIIATKADKIKRSQLKKQEKMIRETLGCAGEIPVIPFSSETKRGREEVFSQIEALTARG